VTFTATDDCGNSSSTTATFTIEDTAPPTIGTDASNSTVECDGAGNMAQLNAWLASNGGAAASDVCSNVTWSNNFAGLSDDCGETGAATVTFTATDDCGNSSSTTATFTIEDSTPPSIDTDASNSTVACDGAGNMTELNAWLAANGNASASDICSNVTWSNDFSALSDDCGETGTAAVTFTATDDCGNSSSTTATFTIVDNTPPSIDTDASNSTVECDGAGNTAQLNAWLAANGNAVASDVCSNVTWSNDFSALSDDCGETGTATVTFTATDDCGNSSSTTATFTIEDTTPPSIDADAANSTVECDGAGNMAQLNAWLASNGNAIASDDCSNVTWSNDFTAFVPDANCPNTGSVTVTFTATDNCGNSSATTATFTIEDTTPPTPFCNNITVQLDASGEAEITVAQIDNNSSDLCCGLASLVLDRTTIFCNEVPSTTVTLTATDFSNNSASCDATITVEDNVDPTAICQDVTVEITPDGTSALTPAEVDNGSFDNCDIGGMSLSKTSFVCADLGDVDVTLTVTDVNGNSSSCMATATVTIQPGLPGAWNGAGIGDTGGADPDFEFDPCTATDPADGEFDISSNGNNAVSTSTDNIAFAYQDLCGDFTVTAKIENISNNGYGGLMVRETGDAGAKQASLFSNLTNLLRHEVRYTENGPKQVFSFFKPSPIWLRIQRQGSFIFFYYSTTGTAFQYVHAVNLPMNNCVQVGLAAFSFIPGQQATATFSNVEVIGSPAPSASIPSTPSVYEEDFQKTPVLFPNPTNQTANLVFADPLATDTRVVLRNQLGQVIEIRTLDAGSNHSEWDVSTLTDGIYLLEIHSEGRNPQVLRLVKAQ
ncbi:MAG: T9SS type A sorting domain-containing protein, partial [Chitinophagales bacterium]|nr:T9SS type A sorting domain-containing protein [Chitinophagales bacterium]